MSNDDETAAMRARFETWREKFNGAIVYEFEFTAYADFAAAEVARALAEERAKTSVFIDGKAVGVADGKFHHVSIVSGPLASTGMASAGPPVCKPWCGGDPLYRRPNLVWCSRACREAARPLNPAPGLSPGLLSEPVPVVQVEFTDIALAAAERSGKIFAEQTGLPASWAAHVKPNDPAASNLSPGLKTDAEFKAAVVAGVADEPPHVCECSNDPCPKCGGGPSGEWCEGSEVTCDDCGAHLVVTDAQPCFGRSHFELVDAGEDDVEDEEMTEVPPADHAALMADTVEPSVFDKALAGANSAMSAVGMQRAGKLITDGARSYEAAGNVPALATTGPTAPCPHCDEDGLCSVCDEDTHDPGPLMPEGAGVGPGPEGAPAAPAFTDSERWPRGSLAEEVSRIVFAFNHKDSRRDDVRVLADKVAAVERDLDEVIDSGLRWMNAFEQVTREDPTCVHCGERAPKTKLDHWQECPKHPARIHVARLEAAQFVLKTRVAELEAEKAAAVLAERERVIGWLDWKRNRPGPREFSMFGMDGKQRQDMRERQQRADYERCNDGIRSGEAAPK